MLNTLYVLLLRDVLNTLYVLLLRDVSCTLYVLLLYDGSSTLLCTAIEVRVKYLICTLFSDRLSMLSKLLFRDTSTTYLNKTTFNCCQVLVSKYKQVQIQVFSEEPKYTYTVQSSNSNATFR